MGIVASFSTPAYAKRGTALSAWNQFVSEHLTELEIQSAKNADFQGSIEVKDLGYLRLANPHSAPSLVTHSRDCLSRYNGDAYLLHLQLSGNSVNRQSGYEAFLQEGDFTLCDTTRPYSLEFDETTKILVAVIPRDALRRRLGNPDRLTCVRMQGTCGVAGLVSTMFNAIWLQSQTQSFDDCGDKLADNFLDLLATSYGHISRQSVDETSTRSARRVMVRDFIERHLSNPDLTPATIAAATQHSVPYLHEIFRGEGETITRFILRRRLEGTAASLADVTMAGISISQIAYQWGFKNTTHFGRCFRERYGLTPREYRQQRFPMAG